MAFMKSEKDRGNNTFEISSFWIIVFQENGVIILH